MYVHKCLHADGEKTFCGKLILKFEFITAINFISLHLFTEGLWFSSVLFFPPVDPVDTESTKMDSSFSLVGLSSSPKKRIRVECRCGSDSCRKYLFWPQGLDWTTCTVCWDGFKKTKQLYIYIYILSCKVKKHTSPSLPPPNSLQFQGKIKT